MSRAKESEDDRSSSLETEDRKRKRPIVPPEEELEIDLNQPEPPSKKAKRKEKKRLLRPKKEDTTAVLGSGVSSEQPLAQQEADASGAQSVTEERSQWGVWIGNLPWTASKDGLRTFFTEHGSINNSAITRLHMPPGEDKGPRWQGPKSTNKGFAYVDFASSEDMNKAIALSEKLMGGRKVLIKNAKSFEGRPEPKKATDEGSAPEGKTKKEPNKRIFVGNLAFDATSQDVEELFSQAGNVEDVHLATFEDSGKCKGYGWVRFAEIEAAEAAVRGFIYRRVEESEDSEEDAGREGDGDGEAGDEIGKTVKKSKPKPRKWFINRLHGRTLRCEFGEDAQSRYKKRFGKTARDPEHAAAAAGGTAKKEIAVPADSGSTIGQRPARTLDRDQRQALRRKRHEDARSIAPGKALAAAQRATGAIVMATGKKTAFE